MKKILITSAVLAAMAGTASAQSNVQLMGTMDAFIGSMRNAGDSGSTTQLGSGGMTTPWFGMKGSEDIGGGLKANFALTSFFNNANGTQGRFTGDTMFSRDANVGLAGDFGSLTLGRALAPNFLPTVIFNPFGDSFTFSPLVLHANVPLFNGTNWNATTPADTGWNNELLYSTPNMSGLSTNWHYQFSDLNNSTGNGNKHNMGVNALYFHGPLALTGFYEKDQVTNPGTSAALANSQTDWMLGGSYDATVVKGFLTYGRATAQAAPQPQSSTLSLGASIPAGPGKIMADYAHTHVNAGNTRSTTSVGYDYSMSKRTDLYAVFMNDRITSFSSGNSFGVGIRHNF